MNAALELPFIGVVTEDVMYAAIAAVVITILIAIVWRAMGKGAALALGILGVIAYIAFVR